MKPKLKHIVLVKFGKMESSEIPSSIDIIELTGGACSESRTESTVTCRRCDEELTAREYFRNSVLFAVRLDRSNNARDLWERVKFYHGIQKQCIAETELDWNESVAPHYRCAGMEKTISINQAEIVFVAEGRSTAPEISRKLTLLPDLWKTEASGDEIWVTNATSIESSGVVHLANRLGISVIDDDNSTPEGSLIEASGRRIVFVNRSLEDSRKKFVIAHELAHYALDHEPNFGHLIGDGSLSESTRAKLNAQEREADALARSWCSVFDIIVSIDKARFSNGEIQPKNLERDSRQHVLSGRVVRSGNTGPFV